MIENALRGVEIIVFVPVNPCREIGGILAFASLRANGNFIIVSVHKERFYRAGLVKITLGVTLLVIVYGSIESDDSQSSV